MKVLEIINPKKTFIVDKPTETAEVSDNTVEAQHATPPAIAKKAATKKSAKKTTIKKVTVKKVTVKKAATKKKTVAKKVKAKK